MYLLTFILLISSVKSFEMPPTWLNPSDLHHSRKLDEIPSSLPEVKPKQTEMPECKVVVQNDSCICPVQPPSSACNSYLQRMINLLLFQAELKDYRLTKRDVVIVPLTLHFTSDNLETLHSFAYSKNMESLSWSEFDQAVTSLFENSGIKAQKGDGLHAKTDYSYFIFVSIIGTLLFIGLWLFLTSGSLYKALCGISLLNISLTLVWNLIRAYKMEKEKFRQQINSEFPENNGETSLPEYDIIFNIDYGAVVIDTFCLIFNILPVLGEKSGAMVYKFYDSQNFFVKYFIQPIQFVFNPLFFLIFMLLLVIVIKGFSLKIPFMSVGVGNDEKVNKREEPPPQQHPHPKNYNICPSGHAFIKDQQPSEHFAGPSGVISSEQAGVNIYHHQSDPSGSNYSCHSGMLAPNSKKRDLSIKSPSITISRKGPWKGSVIRYGFSNRRIKHEMH